MQQCSDALERERADLDPTTRALLEQLDAEMQQAFIFGSKG